MIELLRFYWKPLAALAIALSLLAYIGMLKTRITALQRDNASLQATIDLTKALGQAQNEKAARIEQGAHAAAIASANQYLSDLGKVKKYNASHPVIKRVPVTVPIASVCDSTTDSSSRQLSGETTSPARVDASPADEVPVGSSLEADCRVTTLMLLHLQQFELEQQEISATVYRID